MEAKNYSVEFDSLKGNRKKRNLMAQYYLRSIDCFLTRLLHGPSFTFQRGAGSRGDAHTSEISGLNLELVEGSLRQIVNLKVVLVNYQISDFR